MAIKLKLIALLLMGPFRLFAQTDVSGTVFDKETRAPLAHVVVYANDRITMTDDAGHYVLAVQPAEQVFFRQLAYDFYSVSSDSLHDNGDVYLARNVIELKDIVISPVDARHVLEKSQRNLIEKIRQNEIRPYLFHLEGSSDTGGERELYALVNITLNRIGYSRYYWGMNLIRRDVIKELNKDDFYFNGHPIGIDLLPQKFPRKTHPDKYTFELQEQDEEHFRIRVSPKKPDKVNHWYHSYTVTKQDTVLVERISQSFSNVSELTFRKRGEQSVQLFNHFVKLNYASDAEAYHMQSLIHIASEKIADGPMQRTLTSKANVAALEEVPKGSEHQKKIKPYDHLLFEIPFLDTPGFWKR
jgi:hypothetical protein